MIAAAFKNSASHDIDANELVTNIDFWRSTVDENALMAVFAQKADTGELPIALSSIGFDLQLSQLYLLALSKGGNSAYSQFLASALRDVTKEQWLSALNTESELMDLALALKADGLELSLAFQDALFAHAKVRLNQPQDAKPRLNWGNVLNLLNSKDLTVLRQQILNLFKSSTGQVSGLVSFYGNLLAQAVLSDGPENSYEHINQIIESPEEAEVLWLTSLLGHWKPHSKSTFATRENWSERVKKTLEGELSESLRDVLQKLLFTMQ